MTRDQILDLEVGASQCSESLIFLRHSIEHAHKGAIGTRNQAPIEKAREHLLAVRVALELARHELGGLQCGNAPCDRVDGICPKCGDQAVRS